jgi:alpha-1,2-mannosyltransferase
MAGDPDGSTIMRRRPWTVVAVVLAFGFLLGTLSRGAESEPIGIDFGVFHAGGSLIGSNGYDAAYDTTTFSEFLNADYFPSLAESRTVSHFISTPAFGWFAQVLSLAPFAVALALWLVLGALVLVPACRHLGLPGWTPAILLVSPMMALNTILGQTGPFALLLFAYLHRETVEQRTIRLGVLAGLLILKPPLAFGYGLLWLIQSRRYLRSLLAAALTGVVLSVPTFVGGFQPGWGFIAAMEERADAESAWSQQSSSVPEFLKLLIPNAPSWVTILSWGIGVGAAAAVILLAQRRFGRDAEVMSAAAVIATVVASPHLLVYDSLVLLVPAAVAYRRGLLTGDRAGMLAAITTASFAFGPVLYNLQYDLVGRGIGMELPALAACVWLLVHWDDQKQAESDVLLPVLADA